MCVCVCGLSPGLNVVEQVLPALVDAPDLVVDLALLGLVGGCDELLSQLLQVSLVLTEQVDLLHTVLPMRERERKRETLLSCRGLDLSCTMPPGLIAHRDL